MHTLRKYGIHRVEAEYSGGHDEGGIADLIAFDKDKNVIDLNVDQEVWDACNDVLTTKFLNWACGATHIGQLYVDMGERKVWTEGSYEEFVPDPDPIEWDV